MDEKPDADRDYIRELMRRVPEFKDAVRDEPYAGEKWPYGSMSELFEFFRATHGQWRASAKLDDRLRDLLQRMADALEFGLGPGWDSVKNLVVIGFIENMFYETTHDELLEVLGPEVRATLQRARKEIARQMEWENRKRSWGSK